MESENVAVLFFSSTERESYLSSLRSQGRSERTITAYRAALKRFEAELPSDGQITQEFLDRWPEQLLEKGLSRSSVNHFITVINGFLKYQGWRELQLMKFYPRKEHVKEVLTREEYLRLLQTAKISGQERLYFVIKTLCGMGLRVGELEEVTVEAVKRGRVSTMRKGSKWIAVIPDCLQEELIEYISRHGVQSGPIFKTAGGQPLDRSNIWTGVKNLCRDARVPQEKANPRNLEALYQNTYSVIEQNFSIWVRQSYAQLLEKEQAQIGWNE